MWKSNSVNFLLILLIYKKYRNIKEEILKIRAIAIRTENQSQEQFKGISFNSNFFQARIFLERTASIKSRLSYSWTDAEKLIAFKGKYKT